jgi:hypothetical protein
MRPDWGYGLFGCFFVPFRFEPGERPPSPEDAAFKFASFFINAEKGRRRPGRPARSGSASAALGLSSPWGERPWRRCNIVEKGDMRRQKLRDVSRGSRHSKEMRIFEEASNRAGTYHGVGLHLRPLPWRRTVTGRRLQPGWATGWDERPRQVQMGDARGSAARNFGEGGGRICRGGVNSLACRAGGLVGWRGQHDDDEVSRAIDALSSELKGQRGFVGEKRRGNEPCRNWSDTGWCRRRSSMSSGSRKRLGRTRQRGHRNVRD